MECDVPKNSAVSQINKMCCLTTTTLHQRWVTFTFRNLPQSEETQCIKKKHLYFVKSSANSKIIPFSGKVILHTTSGDVEIELWSKEAPKTCRNFVQLCLEGYYTNTIFHRIVPGFIIQGGDPTSTGHGKPLCDSLLLLGHCHSGPTSESFAYTFLSGGESIYGEPFADEFHSRLRFVRRGLVAMANAGPNDNGSQFFFTLDRTDELQNKHTIFGRV